MKNNRLQKPNSAHWIKLISLAVTVAAIAAAQAGTFTWTNGNGTNEWTDPGNWKADSCPGLVNQNKGDKAHISLNGECKAVIESKQDVRHEDENKYN